MGASKLSTDHIELAAYFLERVVPRGSIEEEQLIATVEALRAEVIRRRRRNNGDH